MSLMVGVIMGLGESKDGDLLGLRSLLNGIITTTPGIELMTAEWNNIRTLSAVVDGLNANDKTIIVGHSHGGDRACEIADGNFGPVKPIDWLITLDAKPRLFGEAFEWLDPDYEYPIPAHAVNCAALYGGFGRPFTRANNALNVLLPEPYQGLSGHGKIPSNPDVQEFIGVKIRELLKA